MCGRFIRTSPRTVLMDELGVEHFVNVDFSPRYNIAPSQTVEGVRLVLITMAVERRRFARWN